jgi:hypothetical protein
MQLPASAENANLDHFRRAKGVLHTWGMPKTRAAKSSPSIEYGCFCVPHLYLVGLF